MLRTTLFVCNLSRCTYASLNLNHTRTRTGVGKHFGPMTPPYMAYQKCAILVPHSQSQQTIQQEIPSRISSGPCLVWKKISEPQEKAFPHPYLTCTETSEQKHCEGTHVFLAPKCKEHSVKGARRKGRDGTMEHHPQQPIPDKVTSHMLLKTSSPPTPSQPTLC